MLPFEAPLSWCAIHNGGEGWFVRVDNLEDVIGGPYTLASSESGRHLDVITLLGTVPSFGAAAYLSYSLAAACKGSTVWCGSTTLFRLSSTDLLALKPSTDACSQYASFNNSRSLHFFLALWPVVGRLWIRAFCVQPGQRCLSSRYPLLVLNGSKGLQRIC